MLVPENDSLGPIGGGGLAASEQGLEVLVDRTTFSGNRATSAANGGGLNMNRANLRNRAQHLLRPTSAADYGGAIVLHASGAPASLALRDVTVTANLANSDSDAAGGGGGLAAFIDVGQTATLELANSILAGNLDFRPRLRRTPSWSPGAC